MELRVDIHGSFLVGWPEDEPVPASEDEKRELLEDAEVGVWDLDDLTITVRPETTDEAAHRQVQEAAAVERARAYGEAMRRKHGGRT